MPSSVPQFSDSDGTGSSNDRASERERCPIISAKSNSYSDVGSGIEINQSKILKNIIS